jgi:cell wall-associated NlpC family hydrolase
VKIPVIFTKRILRQEGEKLRRLTLVFLVALAVLGVAGVEAQSAPSRYSQVVDNATEGRFEADEGWGTGSHGKDVHDEDYRFARPAEDETFARFKVEIPQSANYAVYARWPRVKGLNASAPVGVMTTSGVEWTKVNQQRDGGQWVRVGVFEMEAGDDYSVFFSQRTSGEGYVAADAVKVVKVSSGAASSEPRRGDSSELRKGDSDSAKGREVVREARTYMRVPYRLGRASRSGIDCSGLTMLVYQKFGIELPHDVEEQYDHGSRVRGKPKAGDLVFFNERGKGISHVGIATGRGTIIHASGHWHRVVETRIEYVRGYAGTKRLL